MKPNFTALAALGRSLFILGASTFFGAILLPVAADGTLPTDWATWRHVLAIGLGAAAAAEFVWIRSHLAQAAAAAGVLPAPASVASKVAPLAILAVFALALTGCLSSAPIVPVTPENSAQVTACENTATLHNDLVIGDFVFSGAGTALGAAGALASDTQAKTDVAIAAAAAGGLAVLTSSIVALTASDFANSHCSSVVGALPLAAPTPKAGQ